MIPLKGALYVIGAAIAALLLWWGYGTYQRAQDAKLTAWKIELEAKDDSLELARLDAAAANAAYNAQVPIYIAGRDRILRDPAKPASPEVRACYESADKLISACELRHRADSTVIVQQAGKITLLENKPNPAARRVVVFGEAMYDFAHLAPVIRLGATARLLGPISLSAATDLSVPPAGESKVTLRALIGARINF